MRYMSQIEWWLWKYIRKGWELFSNQTRVEMDGCRTRFWHDLYGVEAWSSRKLFQRCIVLHMHRRLQWLIYWTSPMAMLLFFKWLMIDWFMPS